MGSCAPTLKLNMHIVEALCAFALLCTAAALPSHQSEASCTEAVRCGQECETLMDGDYHLCHCSGNETSFPIKDRPQIVYLTFDDAFTAQAESQFYRSLFNGTFTNPNGCAIRATHFITQSYTDYELVNQYWHMGHEMAAHSITHRNDPKYWQNMDVEGWKAEMVGVRKMIGQFAALDPCEVRGTRAPFLQGGGDNMFQMLAENHFLYDCSWPTRNYGYLEAMNGLYPYTLDYKSIQDCPIKPCPKCSWPGIWEQPMIDLEDEWYGSNPINPDNGNVCSMLDGCVIPDNFTKEHVYDMLMKNFRRVYVGGKDDFGDDIEGTRAPWGLYMHAAWFFGENVFHYDGYKMFLEEITNNDKYPDVYIVPVIDGLKYMRNPLPNQLLNIYGKDDTKSPFGCSSIEDQTGKYDHTKFRCGGGQSCRFSVDEPDDNIGPGAERYMRICKYKWENNKPVRQNCPEEDMYPWMSDNCGGNEPCADCEQDFIF